MLMSRKYKFHNKEGVYFVSFAVVYWIDVFIRDEYSNIFIDTLKFYEKDRLELFAFCIMSSHVHLIFRDKHAQPQELLGNIKRYSSNALIKAITNNVQESRKEWLLWMMQQAASKSSNVHQKQFWQHHNQPIELWSREVVSQKLDYIHKNLIVSGLVTDASAWKYSSAVNHSGENSVIDIILLE